MTAYTFKAEDTNHHNGLYYIYIALQAYTLNQYPTMKRFKALTACTISAHKFIRPELDTLFEGGII